MSAARDFFLILFLNALAIAIPYFMVMQYLPDVPLTYIFTGDL